MQPVMQTLIAVALGLAICGAQAQGFPSKPIHWVSPWAPGGANDILSRSISNEISKTLGQPVIVENRPGASGTTGTAIVAKAPPDGYTVTLGSTPSYATAPSMYPALAYDPVKDFAPVTLVARVANLLVVHPSVPAATVKELIAYAKANSGNQRNATRLRRECLVCGIRAGGHAARGTGRLPQGRNGQVGESNQDCADQSELNTAAEVSSSVLECPRVSSSVTDALPRITSCAQPSSSPV